MTDKLFQKLWLDALEQTDKDKYVQQHLEPDWSHEILPGTGTKQDILEDIHDAAHTTFKEILKKAGISQTDFSTKFCIPLRTVQNWANDTRKCPDYIRLILLKLLKADMVHSCIIYNLQIRNTIEEKAIQLITEGKHTQAQELLNMI